MSDALAECKTLSVPNAGKLYFDLSRNASYDAVKRGQIPVVKIGRKYRVPIAAMDTGGTRDIIEPDVTGLLSSTPEGLADDVRRLRGDEALRQRLGEAARRKVEREFDAAAVVARVERLYEELTRRPGRSRVGPRAEGLA